MVKTKRVIEYKRFIRFLKENSAFIAYIREIKNNNSNRSSFVFRYEKNLSKFFDECYPASWLDYCFIWENTMLGYAFWSDLSDKWINEYRNNKKK